MVIIEEDTDVEIGVGVGVRETGTRGGGRVEGVDRWADMGFSQPRSVAFPFLPAREVWRMHVNFEFSRMAMVSRM